MVWGCMSAAGTGELRFIERNMDSNMYCDILKQSMFLDLNPIEHMWGILKRKVENHHVSNIQQLRDVIMEEWKRSPATALF